MEFYKNMCDGELLAFYRAAKRSSLSFKSMEAEIAKIEEELRARDLDTDNLKLFKELNFYASKMLGIDKECR